MIYFDNSATTRPDEDIVQLYLATARDLFGNPSSSHRLGLKAHWNLEEARHVAAACLGVEADEIFFTSSGTESNNTALKGLAQQNRSHGKHIITTCVEHSSVYETCRHLETLGYSVTYLPTDEHGCVRVEEVREALREDTIIVSLSHVNSELGSVQPIEEIGKLLSAHTHVRFHVDAVQGYGKLELSPKEWGIDSLSLSAHKFHGLRGTGLLYVRSGVTLSPLLHGGGQESGLRSSTEHVAGIVAMSAAMQKGHVRLEENARHLTLLKNVVLEGLSQIPNVVLNSPEREDPRGVPHIVNFSLLGVKASELVRSLEQNEIYVSKSSACSSKQEKPSRVLLAAGVQPTRVASAIRVSFSAHNTLEEVEEFLFVMQKLALGLI